LQETGGILALDRDDAEMLPWRYAVQWIAHEVNYHRLSIHSTA
jgi:hypothetical protein